MKTSMHTWRGRAALLATMLCLALPSVAEVVAAAKAVCYR